jgi:cytochrome P450
MSGTPAHVPEDLVRDFDHVTGADFVKNPFEAFAGFRGDRAFFSPHHGGYWVLTLMADIREALQRAETFSSWPTGIPAQAARTERMAPLELDPPEHRSYRRVIAPMFGVRAISSKTAAIDTTVEHLLTGLPERGGCEFVAGFAQPFPSTIFTNMLGLPPAEADKFVSWNNTLLHAYGDPDARRVAATDINAYLRDLIAGRAGEPREDLVSALLAAEVDGRPITREEVQNLCFLLFVAGLDTVTAALTFMFRFLAENPAHRQQILDDPEIIPSAVEELLRVHAFVNPARTVTEDLEFAGVRMKAGDRVLVSTVLASNDPVVFPDPLEVRFDREANRHLAFGAGPHRCAGSHLARGELVAAIRRWHEVIPHYEIDPDHEIESHAGGAMGIDRIHLRWPPRGG